MKFSLQIVEQMKDGYDNSELDDADVAFNTDI